MSGADAHQAPQATASTATAAAAAEAPGAASSEPLRHAGLAQLNGHAARYVGAMLGGLIGDVLGEIHIEMVLCIGGFQLPEI